MKDITTLLQFSPNDYFLEAARKRSHAIALGCEDGRVLRDQSFPNRQAPIDIAISSDYRMVNFAYRARAVLLGSLDNEKTPGACGGEAASSAMISNSSP